MRHGIPHRHHHHEAGCDRRFEPSKKETASSKTTEVVTKRSEHQNRTPAEDTSADDLTHPPLLRREDPGVFGDQVSEVEYTSEPRVLILGDAGACEQVKNRRVRHSLLVDVLKNVGHRQKWQDHKVDLFDQPALAGCVAKKLVQIFIAEVVLSKEFLSLVKVDGFTLRDGCGFGGRFDDFFEAVLCLVL